MVVALACATGLTVPIIISVVLVLRARGVCCRASFEPIEKFESHVVGIETPSFERPMSDEGATQGTQQPAEPAISRASSIPFPELQPKPTGASTVS